MAVYSSQSSGDSGEINSSEPTKIGLSKMPLFCESEVASLWGAPSTKLFFSRTKSREPQAKPVKHAKSHNVWITHRQKSDTDHAHQPNIQIYDTAKKEHVNCVLIKVMERNLNQTKLNLLILTIDFWEFLSFFVIFIMLCTQTHTR